MIRSLTESGDFYEGTLEAWDRYHQAIEDGDYDTVMFLETGQDPDFRYAP